jgi:hypothetical protein
MPSSDQQRKDRLAAALRDNLRKRKDQNRAVPRETRDTAKAKG